MEKFQLVELINKCDGLAWISNLPKSIISIGYQAFHWCSALQYIEIPNSVKRIEDYAFASCGKLGGASGAVVMSESVEGIGKGAFRGTKLQAIDLGKALKTIGEEAFANCDALYSVSIPNSIEQIGNNVFNNCTALQFNQSGALKYLGNDQNPYVVLFKPVDYSTLVSCEINDGCRIILRSAFYYCKALETVSIPESVITIGDYAFSSCDSLKKLTLPNSIKFIGKSVFDNIYGPFATAYENGYYVGSTENPYLVYIGHDNRKENAIIKEGCKFISVSPYGSGIGSLTTVVIPRSVEYISESSFEECSHLSVVYYEGNIYEWYSIEINYHNEKLNKNRFYYSVTKPVSSGKYWHYVDGTPTPWTE